MTSKDYVWGLAFGLAAVLAVQRGMALRGGLLLGLAMGCRITYGAMALPLCLLLVNAPGRRKPISSIASFGLGCVTTAAAVFLPVFLRYGRGFLTFYDSHERPGWREILPRATVEVWESPGLLGLIIAVCAIIIRQARSKPAVPPKTTLPGSESSGCDLLAWGGIMVIYIAAFLALPDQAGYLLPVVPFVFLILARVLAARGVRGVLRPRYGRFFRHFQK